MFNDHKHSGRRAFLRGLGGAALALPLLEYTHGHAWAKGNGAPCRFLTVFSHGGTISNQQRDTRADGTGAHHGQDLWRPADPLSEDLVLGPIHQPLEPFRQKLLLLEGIDNKTAITQDQYNAGGHGISNATALTAGDSVGTEDGRQALSASIDQVIAERLSDAQPTPFERIHLKVKGHQYGTPYFRGANEPMSGITNPAEAWATLFAGVSEDGQPSPAAQRQLSMRGSALDGLLESYDRVRNTVSATDRHQIDAHLEHLRALEHELQNPVVCSKPDEPGGDGDGNIVGPLHVQLIVAALRCGLSNVANLEISDIVTPWTDAGTPTDSAYGIGHSLHHLARDIGPTGAQAGLYDAFFAEMLDNRRWRMSLMAQLLEGLDDPNFLEGDGTLLDNSLVLYTSEFRNGSIHTAWNMPVLLAGSAGGALSTGRFIDYNQHGAAEGTLQYETSESTHNLFTSILQALGQDDQHFGNGDASHQGPLPGLT
jgi:hypothetical protein